MPRRRMYFFKYMTMFFLGASAVMLGTYASVSINTSLNNAIQYVQKIVLTNDGGNSNNSITGIMLDGSNGNAFFSGNVGIGIDTPSSKFHVQQNSGNLFFVGDYAAGNIESQINLGYGTGTKSGFMIGTTERASDHLGFRYVLGGGSPILFGASGNLASNIFYPAIVITTGNQVGIGTHDPQAIFGVLGTSFLNGNVGIGTPSSSERLTVDGNIILTTGGNDSYPRTLSVADSSVGGGYPLGISAGDAYDDDHNGGNLYLNAGSVGSVIGQQDGDGGDVYINGGVGGVPNYYDGNVILANSRGKVGIGTTNPGAMLTVNGGIKAKPWNANPCANTGDYPNGTMFYVPEYQRTNPDPFDHTETVVAHYCFCDSHGNAKALDIPGNACTFDPD